MVSLLDLGEEGLPSRVIEFSWRAPSTTKVIKLDRTPKALEIFGLARPNDGTIWILADKGRSVARFDESTGKLLHYEALPQPSQGIWDFGQRVVFALMQLRGGEPLLSVADRGGFRSFTNLKSRGGRSALEILARNLFRCGIADGARLPCWWSSGSPEAVLIRGSGEVDISTLASLIDNRLLTPSANPPPSIESTSTGLPYPIRDVLLLSSDSRWVLTNQEGAVPISTEGAIRARHVLRLDPGKKAKVVDLPKAGLAMLGGDENRLLMLYEDGSIAWLNCR